MSSQMLYMYICNNFGLCRQGTETGGWFTDSKLLKQIEKNYTEEIISENILDGIYTQIAKIKFRVKVHNVR